MIAPLRIGNIIMYILQEHKDDSDVRASVRDLLTNKYIFEITDVLSVRVR